MDSQSRSGFAFGILLIFAGMLFLAYQFFPGLFGWLQLETSWPLLVIGIGFLLLILGLVTRAPGMAVPAFIVGGIGGILYYQNVSGNWGSWAYLWTLIPGFTGLGTIVAGLMGEGRLDQAVSNGVGSIISSMIMFAIFGSFLGGFQILGMWWPALLIFAGVLLLLRNFWSRRSV